MCQRPIPSRRGHDSTAPGWLGLIGIQTESAELEVGRATCRPMWRTGTRGSAIAGGIATSFQTFRMRLVAVGLLVHQERLYPVHTKTRRFEKDICSRAATREVHNIICYWKLNCCYHGGCFYQRLSFFYNFSYLGSQPACQPNPVFVWRVFFRWKAT